MKTIYETLEMAGLTIPFWLTIVILVILILIGVSNLWNKFFKNWIKKIFKIENDLNEIDEINLKLGEEIIRSNQRDDELDLKIDCIENKLDNISETLKLIQTMSENQATDNKGFKEGLKTLLCNELDKRYRRYVSLGYIPENEFNEYVDMYNAYHNPPLMGNHSGTEKFEYCMNHLDRKGD